MSLDLVDTSDVVRRPNKYGARRTWSELCQRHFASKAEALRGEELRAMEMAGEIYPLTYQPAWVLSTKPKITYTADFKYFSRGDMIIEDVKGVLTRDTRTKIAWVRQLHGIQVRVLFRDGDGWKEKL